jgi:Ca2+-binding RTX toxin-like protein
MKRFHAVVAAAAFVFTAMTAHAAGKCQPYEPGVTVLLANSACYYATGPINDSGLFVPIGVVLNGTDADDTVGQVNGTFNGGAGNDSVSGYLGDSGTFNGGKGDDYMQALSDAGTFNGGPGDDTTGFMYDGTFSGGAGSDVVNCLYGGTTWSVTEGICD